MPVVSTEEIRVARWNLRGNMLQQRTYRISETHVMDGHELKPVLGRNLPAHEKVLVLKKMLDTPEVDVSSDLNPQEILKSVKLFTNLPLVFYSTLLDILESKENRTFPLIMRNKLPTASSCIRKMSPVAINRLALTNWKELGWSSEATYKDWLATETLFAFTGCGHYCSTPRMFEYDPVTSTPDLDSFKRCTDNRRETHIFSIAGFECRGIADASEIEILLTSGKVQKYSELLMKQILGAALETNTTDIVFIPVGMGVFLTHKKNEMKNKMLDGYINALNQYNNEKQQAITIHCCLIPGQFEYVVARLTNPLINIQNRQGQDAYCIANAIQDDLGRKSMLINAGDHDWSVSLDRGNPGQFALNHSLFHSTSDEYFGLVTLFSFCSIANLKKAFANILPYIFYIPNDENLASVALQTPPSAEEADNGEENCIFAISCLRLNDNGELDKLAKLGSEFKKKFGGNDFSLEIQNSPGYNSVVLIKKKKPDFILTPDLRDDFEKFISNYKYSGGHKLHLIMSELKSKIDAVEKDKFPRASMAADTLLDNLNKAVYQYEYEDSSIQAFQASYTRAVKDATSILEKDLGWGDYLINLLKSLANAVIWGITLSTSISFFSPTETALGTIVREAKQDLDQGYTNSYD